MTRERRSIAPRGAPAILRAAPNKNAVVDDKFLSDRLKAAFEHYCIDQADPKGFEQLSYVLLSYIYPGFRLPEDRDGGGRPSAPNEEQQINLAVRLDELKGGMRQRGDLSRTINAVISANKIELIKSFPFLGANATVKSIAEHARRGRKAKRLYDDSVRQLMRFVHQQRGLSG